MDGTRVLVVGTTPEEGSGLGSRGFFAAATALAASVFLASFFGSVGS